MKLMALVLIGIVMGLGLVFLPSLGTTSFFQYGAATQATLGENKNTSGDTSGYLPLDVGGSQPKAAEGNSIYRSISESPAGAYGVPATILALGVVAAVGAYLIIRRSVP